VSDVREGKRAMPDLVVETKLLAPRVRVGSLRRARLDGLLRRGSDAGLTLVAAPAGFGKTTLLGSWLGSAGGPRRATAWVSLDERDHQPTSFWGYVLLALERAVPGVATAAHVALESGQAPMEHVLATLLNEISVLPDELDLVLDDYHLADGPGIRSGMTFLLEHRPPQLHLVISTRADPALPLARLRARGELVEIRAAELRFTHEEVTTYLTGVSGLELAAPDIAALEGRTEGWIAALQLATLSLEGREDVGGFIAGFAGDDRYVVDYLVDEVLDRQPQDVRGFLLETSVLGRLTGPLCDAVTGRLGGKAMLDRLDRQNLFVVPLDDHRRWYRYHHLFADVLQAHLLQERPDAIAELHRRASRWYADAGDAAAGVRHALAAGDGDRAADLVEQAVPALRRDRHEDVIRSWIDDIPPEVVAHRPVLAIGFVGALMASNEFDGVDERLADIERMLAAPAADMVIAEPDELSRVPGAIETYRAALALVAGRPSDTMEHARLARTRAVDDDHLTISAAWALSGLASLVGGDLDNAHTSYAAAAAGLQRAGHLADVLGCSITLADVEITQGRLDEAQRTYEHALELAGDGLAALRGTADMYVGLSQLALERSDLSAAAGHLRRSDALGERAGLPQNPYRWRVAMARLRQAEGDRAAAVSLLDEATRVYVGDFMPDVRPIRALRARVLAAQGDVVRASAWAHEHGLTADDELSYLREYEHVTLARVLLAEHAAGTRDAVRDALGLLERLLTAAERGGRVGTVIEVLVLQSLALHIADPRAGGGPGPHAATQALERALTLAEPQGYVRVFIGEGRPMVDLLRRLDRRRPGWQYLQLLLRAATTSAGSGVDVRPDPHQGQLVEPLSERELDVLRLLASELDGPSIARALVVSLNTVRTHTKHIYTKLGVNSRRAAVRQAHQLNLLAGHRDGHAARR
jgi:LuxR family maltose regulon positive regulatory protein